VYVRRVARDEHTANAKLRNVAMMDAKVGAPHQRTRFDALGRTFGKHPAHHFE
jgi:hypothetical protein